MEILHLQASRTPVDTGACILHGKRKRAEYLTRWSLMSILQKEQRFQVKIEGDIGGLRKHLVELIALFA